MFKISNQYTKQGVFFYFSLKHSYPSLEIYIYQILCIENNLNKRQTSIKKNNSVETQRFEIFLGEK